ncbi:ANTAR domain-containing protein [Massilia litorea]|jgi:CheY-like chemotaxis protein|uniref:Response regulator n=1 Tax=Massilia litorea TaxID=2769491 RepID=A0A7L9U4K6_9BURK|nr:response regulator [Massilia litorea]QOL50001.1 response regulator [Massilia litorea]
MFKPPEPFRVLLVEPANLLRQSVSLTMRSLGTAEVIEAANYATATQACQLRRFDGAIITVAWPPSREACKGLVLIQEIRAGQYAVGQSVPISVLVEVCDAELLHMLRTQMVTRILIKPFRVRDVIDTIDTMRTKAPSLVAG